MFEREHGTALHKMQVIRASSEAEGDVSWDFSSSGRILEYILELQSGWPFETPLCSENSGLLSSWNGHLRNLNYVWKVNTVASGGEVGDQASFLFSTEILGFLSIFKNSQTSAPFEALISVGLSRC